MLDTNSSWSANNNTQYNTNPDYIKLDLGSEMNVTGIVVQGKSDVKQIITSYNVSYSNDNSMWISVNDNNSNKMAFTIDPLFYINDSAYKYKNLFNNPVVARYIKIIPLTNYVWNSARVGVLTTIQVPTTTQYESYPTTMYTDPTSIYTDPTIPELNAVNKIPDLTQYSMLTIPTDA